MKKRIRMEGARPLRQKLLALPHVPPPLKSELDAAKQAYFAFLDEFKRQPMKWGIIPYDEIVSPYKERIDQAEQRVQMFLENPQSYLTHELASHVLGEYKGIILSEQQSQKGQQPKGSNLLSEDASKWNGNRIAEAARQRGYASSSDKDSIIRELISRSGKSEATVRRAIREGGLTKTYKETKRR
jgi:hypothetical protein